MRAAKHHTDPGLKCLRASSVFGGSAWWECPLEDCLTESDPPQTETQTEQSKGDTDLYWD